MRYIWGMHFGEIIVGICARIFIGCVKTVDTLKIGGILDEHGK